MIEASWCAKCDEWFHAKEACFEQDDKKKYRSAVGSWLFPSVLVFLTVNGNFPSKSTSSELSKDPQPQLEVFLHRGTRSNSLFLTCSLAVLQGRTVKITAGTIASTSLFPKVKGDFCQNQLAKSENFLLLKESNYGLFLFLLYFNSLTTVILYSIHFIYSKVIFLACSKIETPLSSFATRSHALST